MHLDPDIATLLRQIPPDAPVLIAGPTASGKSALALAIAEAQGGVIVNADASQVFDCWRVVTARPSADEEARARHALYGHLPFDAAYSAGHWLREVTPWVRGPTRPIIVGGTGLYFTALTEGLADIPATPPETRAQGDQMSLPALIEALDADTAGRIDLHNRARVQRAWEVLSATGQGLAAWQAQAAEPVLPLEGATAIVIDADKEFLTPRIAQRFEWMLENGALEEAAAMRDRYDPSLPSCKAIGVPQVMAHLAGALDREQTIEQGVIATRQYAKRQRTWFRSKMRPWRVVKAETLIS